MGDDFDAIVVGAGFAGCAAAIRLAQGGANTLLLERGAEPGTKNLSGGILWGHDLDPILPKWQEEMPLERHIISKRFGFLTRDKALSFEYRDDSWDRPPYNAHSVLRSRTDAWLAKKAEEAGATLVSAVPVDRLHLEGEKVRGVVQSGEVMTAPVTLVTDGYNTRTTIGTSIRKGDPPRANSGQQRLPEDHSEVGVKEVFSIDPSVLEDRFGVDGLQGRAQEWVLGFLPPGVMGGGFLYTNRDTLSLGIIVQLGSLKGRGIATHEIIERFKLHPAIEPLIRGGELLEYGAKLIPDGYSSRPDKFWGDGFMIAGDAAGFVFSNGIVIQGMSYAARSGILAAETALEAIKAKDFSARGLASYGERLIRSNVLPDFQHFEGMDRVKWNSRIFSEYPEMMTGVFHDWMTATPQGPPSLMKAGLSSARAAMKVGWRPLLQDLVDAAREV
ncbi:MAG: FAD-dependent oxidoreductase [Euryarchaeota archaeon]|nr:FAD-dependent oxidoreductase [Euryarchaeota archaeon]MDE1881387.1 FAD-dependent oxidoreductase [Euryarchaeota archaeon]